MTEQRITDNLHNYYSISLLYQEILHEEQTAYQHLQVVNTKFFGKVLILDHIIQLTELDNAGYHEMIVHVPMLAHDHPQRVLIVGGGDGGALQQVLRYQTVEQVVLCELDRRVVESCREFFPEFGRSFDDARVELVIQDAFDYLQRTEHKFDVIIADTTDPVGEAAKLFSDEFYGLMMAALRENGVVVTQCEHIYLDTHLIKAMMEIARSLAHHPAYYYTTVPTYPGGGIGFLYISDVPWEKGLGKPYPGPMNYLNREVHQAAFALPEFLKRLLR